MIVPVHASNCNFYLFYVNGYAKEVGFVIKRYAVRNAKIRPYTVRRLKIMQYARGKGVSPS